MISSDCRAAMAAFSQLDLVEGLLDQPYPCEAAIPYASYPRRQPFISAEADDLNSGVYRIDPITGTRQWDLTPHHPFLDDMCLAETRAVIPKAIHASLHHTQYVS